MRAKRRFGSTDATAATVTANARDSRLSAAVA